MFLIELAKIDMHLVQKEMLSNEMRVFMESSTLDIAKLVSQSCKSFRFYIWSKRTWSNSFLPKSMDTYVISWRKIVFISLNILIIITL